jgi:hypothetical protein
MAWRPMKYLIEGELDNTRPGRVTEWMSPASRIGAKWCTPRLRDTKRKGQQA